MNIIKLQKLDNEYLESLLKEKHGCPTTETDENLGCPITELPQKHGCPITENNGCPTTKGYGTTEKSSEKGYGTIRLTGYGTTTKTGEIVMGQPEKSCGTTENGYGTTSKGKRINQWRKEHKDSIRIDLPKGSKATLQAVSRDKGVSVSALIREALSIYLD